MPLFQKSDPNILRILAQVVILNQKLDKLMSTNNNLASQLQAAIANIGALETKIESDLASLASNQNSALADLKAWLSSNQGGQIDSQSIATLNGIASRFETVDSTLTTLATAAQTSDPGQPPAAPVNG
jgi:hypothetical protein